jgi:hypothetical protein
MFCFLTFFGYFLIWSHLLLCFQKAFQIVWLEFFERKKEIRNLSLKLIYKQEFDEELLILSLFPALSLNQLNSQ